MYNFLFFRFSNNEQVEMEVCGISMGSTKYEDPPFSVSGYKMKNLQFLDINSGRDLLERILSVVRSPNLIWLRWRNCGHSSLPSWIPMKKLGVLEVHGGNLEMLWQEEQQVNRYVLALSY